MAYYGSRIVSNMSPYHRTKVNFGAHSTAILLAEFSKIVHASPQKNTTVLLLYWNDRLNCENKPFFPS
jgi:hypothetical protein